MKFKSALIIFVSVFLLAGCTQTTVTPEPAQVAPATNIAPKVEAGDIPVIPTIKKTNGNAPIAPPPPPAPPTAPSAPKN